MIKYLKKIIKNILMTIYFYSDFKIKISSETNIFSNIFICNK